jgi:hypothetical protein
MSTTTMTTTMTTTTTTMTTTKPPTTPEVTVEILGGLGNQLFQICTLISYCLEHDRPFMFDEAAPIRVGQRKKTYWDTPLLRGLLRHAAAAALGPPELYLKESGFNYSALPVPPPLKPCKLVGYFQSYKYFLAHEAAIIQLLQIRELQKTVLAKVKKTSLASASAKGPTTTVAMHFRLGDYLIQPQNYVKQPLAYYRAALEDLVKALKNTPEPSSMVATLPEATVQVHYFCVHYFCVQYFCEPGDRASVLAHYIAPLQAIFPAVTFISGAADTVPDWLQLVLISLCTHTIMANSTFSWWGAYLNAAQMKRVYYPADWFGLALKARCPLEDLCPPSWRAITV